MKKYTVSNENSMNTVLI
jgi:dynein heavy chain